MRVLSLFSGGGLGDYGLELAGMEIVGQVEIDEYCQKILKLRWPDVPKWTDIKNVTGKEILERVGAVDLVSGGFPCQPFSTAGRRTGTDDNRYLWPEMYRIICEVKPRWVLAENVPGLLSISNGRVFGEVVRDLAESRYGVEWDCIPASAVGAPHRRDRVWIVGYSEHNGQSATEVCGSFASGSNNSKTGEIEASEFEGPSFLNANVADSKRTKFKRFRGATWNWRREFGCCSWWKVEPAVGRVAHGVANRVDRLKLLGNGQVVQVVEWIGQRIMEFTRPPGTEKGREGR